MPISEDFEDLYSDKKDPDLNPTGEDHTKTRSGSFGVSIDEAATREDVILDRSLGLWRETTADDVITKDTVRAFDLGGGVKTDMTLREAYQFGLLSEWNDEWGEAYDRPDLTDEEREALEAEAQRRKPATAPDPSEHDLHEDTPLEATNFILEADINGVDRKAILPVANDFTVDADGRVSVGGEAKEFLQSRYGIPPQSAAEVAQGIHDAWSKVARETIGEDAIRQISLAAKYNPEAAEDVSKIQKRALIGILSKDDLRTMQAKWAK